jgi:hypothetical protein
MAGRQRSYRRLPVDSAAAEGGADSGSSSGGGGFSAAADAAAAAAAATAAAATASLPSVPEFVLPDSDLQRAIALSLGGGGSAAGGGGGGGGAADGDGGGLLECVMCLEEFDVLNPQVPTVCKVRAY